MSTLSSHPSKGSSSSLSSLSGATGTGIRQVAVACSGHTRPIVHLEFSKCTPYGYFLISGSKDGKPMLRLGSTGDWIGTFLGHKGAVNGVTLSADACKAATASSDFTSKVWDAVSGEEIASFTHAHIVKCVAFNPDCNKLVTGGNEKIVRMFDMEKPDADPVVYSGHSGAIKNLSFLPDGRRFITLSDVDKTAKLWDVNNTSECIYEYRCADATLNSFEVSADGKYLVICEGQNIHVSEILENTFKPVRDIKLPTVINWASIDPYHKYIACGGADFIIRRLEFDTGLELDAYKGHFGPVHCVKFSPDGELYASGSEDGTLRLWQTNVGTNYGMWKVVKPDELTCSEQSSMPSGDQPPLTVQSTETTVTS